MRTRGPAVRKAFFEAKAEKDSVLFRRLALMPPQQAYTLLQKCGIPRATYLLRTHHPRDTGAYSKSFDCRNLDVLESAVLQSPIRAEGRFLREETSILVHLPRKDGGIGITRTQCVSHHMFGASADRSLRVKTPEGLPTADQQTRIAAYNKTLVTRIDGMGSLSKSHRTACSLSSSSQWMHRATSLLSPAQYSAMVRFRVVCYDSDVAEVSTCQGCHRQYDARAYHAHKAGCARVLEDNATVTHNAVRDHLGKLALRAGVFSTKEPRYESYVPQSTDHKKGPDRRFHFPHHLTIDIKGMNPCTPCYARRDMVKQRAAVERAARELYERHVFAAGERFEVVFFYITGWLCEKMKQLLLELCNSCPTQLVYEDELADLQAVITHHCGNEMLRHGHACGPRRSDRC